MGIHIFKFKGVIYLILNICKKACAMLLAVGLLVGSGIATVDAANRVDTGWSYSMFGDLTQGTMYTGARVKEDASKSYTNVKAMEGSYLKASIVDEFKVKISDHTTDINGVGQYWITNLAHENGFRNVRMKLDSNFNIISDWGASGVWSPDSGK